VSTGCRTWCECGWNVADPPPAEPPGRLARIYAGLGRRHGARLFDRVLRDGAERPRAGAATIALAALSCAVLASWLAVVAAAVLIVVAWPERAVAWMAAALVGVVAWALRPGVRRQRDTLPTAPDTHPRLHALVREVAEAVGAAPPHAIELTDQPNAFAGRCGLLRRRTLILGVPLLVTLDAQETVALLGHEIAHFANGDSSRSVLVSAAHDTLIGWCRVVYPDEHDARRGFAQYVAGVAMWVLHWIPRGLLVLASHLEWAESQRAEFYADRLSASVAGTDAAVSSLERHLHVNYSVLRHACHRVVVGGSKRGVLAELAFQAAEVPARERERRRRAAAIEPSSLDATHPPTGHRIRMLSSGPRLPARVVFGEANRAELLRELERDVARTEATLASAYERSLYR
jgi:Zn-dependent protease with chaperone function